MQKIEYATSGLPGELAKPEGGPGEPVGMLAGEPGRRRTREKETEGGEGRRKLGGNWRRGNWGNWGETGHPLSGGRTWKEETGHPLREPEEPGRNLDTH
jgi:hypothetical protein